MPDPKTQKKKTNPLFFLLFFVIVLAAGYYYYINYVQTPPPVEEVAAPLPILTTGDWEKEVYQNPAYSNLVNPIPGKVTPGPLGNPQPFVQVAPSEARN